MKFDPDKFLAETESFDPDKFLNETEEQYNLETAAPKPDVSMLESAGRGAVQGATLGFGDEIGAFLKAIPEKMSQDILEKSNEDELRSLVRKIEKSRGYKSDKPVKVEDFSKELKADDFTDIYKNLKDVTRESNKEASEANPATYFAGEIGGGVLPALATGGGSAAVSAGALTKEGLKQAAKLGAGYGAASGLGYSEADDLSGLATDTALGGVMGAGAGAALPVIGKGLKSTAGKIASGTGKTLESLIPESGAIKAGYSYGREGKALTEDIVQEDMKSVVKDILKKFEKVKNAKSLKKFQDDLDKAGIKVNTKESLESAIDDLKKIAQDDMLEVSDTSLLPKLQKLAGIDIQAEKMTDKAKKTAIKKALEAEGRGQQAIISGEKKLAKEAIQSGDDLVSIQDIQRSMDDLELPLTTPDGKIGGVKGKFVGSEGEYSKQILSDVTDYQPQISSILGPDGRPIIKTTDLGSGKISAIVGDIENKIQRDLSNLTVSEVEAIRKQLNVVTDLAKSQGIAKDPVIARARQLAVELRDLTNKAIEASGDDSLITARKRMSDLLSAEDLLGISKTKAVNKQSAEAEKIRTLVDKLGFKRGFKTSDEAKEAFEKLGEDIVSPTDISKFERFKQLNAVMGRESQENISKAGIYKKLVGYVPNIAGRAVKKIISPVVKGKTAITNLTNEQMASYGQKLSSSENKGLQDVGQRLLDAADMEDTAKHQLLWSLSQSPAMRQFIKQQAGSVEQDEQAIVETPVNPLVNPPVEPPVNPPQSSVDMPKFQQTSGVEDTQQGREPSGKFDSIRDAESEYDKEQVKIRKDAIYNGLKERGLSHDETIAIMANIAQEAGPSFSPNIKQNHSTMSDDEWFKSGSARGTGLIQWDNRRKDQVRPDGTISKGLKTFADEKGKPWNDLDTQLDFLVYEMQGDEKSNWNKVKEKNTIEEKTLAFEEFFERAGKPHVNKRLMNAKKLMEEYPNYSEDPMYQNIEDASKDPSLQFNSPILDDAEAEIQDLSRSIDMANQMQSSGDGTPVDQLDDLLAKLDMLRVSEEDIKDLQDDAVNMTGYRDGELLKQKITRLLGA